MTGATLRRVATMVDGRTVTLVEHDDPDLIAGLDAYGHLVYRCDYGDRSMYPLTDCCHASASYHDDTLCCKGCWFEVGSELGAMLSPDDLATTLDRVDAEFVDESEAGARNG